MMNNTNYTLCLKKVYRLMFDNNFGKGEPFSKSFHQLIRRKILYVYTTKIFTNACNILLDYLVKVENPKKKLLILTANLKKKKINLVVDMTFHLNRRHNLLVHHNGTPKEYRSHHNTETRQLNN